MSRNGEQPSSPGLAAAVLQAAAGFLVADVLMPGRPATATARRIRAKAAAAAARWHQQLHDWPWPGEDFTTPEHELHPGN